MEEMISYVFRNLKAIDKQSKFNRGIVSLGFTVAAYILWHQQIEIDRLNSEITKLKHSKGE